MIILIILNYFNDISFRDNFEIECWQLHAETSCVEKLNNPECRMSCVSPPPTPEKVGLSKYMIWYLIYIKTKNKILVVYSISKKGQAFLDKQYTYIFILLKETLLNPDHGGNTGDFSTIKLQVM